MPTYIFLIKMTEQGIKSVKDLSKRVKGGRESIEKAGGNGWTGTLQWESMMQWLKRNLHDYTAATVALALGKLGNVRTTTLKAFSEAEMKKIVEKIP